MEYDVTMMLPAIRGQRTYRTRHAPFAPAPLFEFEVHNLNLIAMSQPDIPKEQWAQVIDRDNGTLGGNPQDGR